MTVEAMGGRLSVRKHPGGRNPRTRWRNRLMVVGRSIRSILRHRASGGVAILDGEGEA